MHMLADAVPTQVTHDSIAKTSGIITDRRRNLMQMIACCRKLDTLEKALSGSLYQKLRVIRDLTDAMRSRCIGLIPFVDHARIKAYDVALLDDAVCTRDSVYDLLVDRYAD